MRTPRSRSSPRSACRFRFTCSCCATSSASSRWAASIARPLASARRADCCVRRRVRTAYPASRRTTISPRTSSGARSKERASSPSGSSTEFAPATCGTIARAATAPRGVSCGPCVGSGGHEYREKCCAFSGTSSSLRFARETKMKDIALNSEQQRAVDARGLVFVSAGAGTGKTKVLVERFARAVCDEGVDVESILVITYTEKAAGELRSRIRAGLVERGRPDLSRELDGAWISTIHGFCNRLLRSHP